MIKYISLTLLLSFFSASVFAAPLIEGSTFKIDGKKATVTVLDTLPYVENTYKKMMVWPKFGDEKLTKFREDLRLDDIVSSGKDEFERQILLMNFIFHLWEFGDPKEMGRISNPEEILMHIKKEKRFFCEQYAYMLASAAEALGWNYRLVSIRHHTFGEMWSNKYKKWVLMDATNNIWPQENGTPLSTQEMLDEVFKSDSKNVILKWGIGKDNKPIGDRFEDYETVCIHSKNDFFNGKMEFDKTFCVNNPYGQNKWKVANVIQNRKEAYFPINQAALTLDAGGGGVIVEVKTFTPNFKAFRARVDAGKWMTTGEKFSWNLHGGKNTLEIKTVNMWENDGALSRVEVEVDGSDKANNSKIGTPSPEEDTKTAGMAPLKTYKSSGAEAVVEQVKEEPLSDYLMFWFKKGHWIEYSADVPAEGDYTLGIEYCTGFYPKRKIEVNGTAVSGLESVTFPHTGGGHTKKYWKKGIVPIKIKLKRGKNSIKFTALDDTKIWLKKILLSKSGGLKEIIIPATDVISESGGKAQRTYVPKDAYFIGWNDKGHCLEWEADVPEADEYDVFIGVGALVPAVRQMKVNGEIIKNDNEFTIEPTGGWRVFSQINFGKATLKKGKNNIRMENINGDGMNLNFIKFISKSGKIIYINAFSFTKEEGGKVLKPK